MCIGDGEAALTVGTLEGGAVEHRTPALVKLLHGLDLLRVDRLGEVVEDGSYLGHLELSYGLHGHGSGNLGEGLAIGVLSQHVAQLVVLGSSLTCFVDGGVVVV